MTGTGHVLTQEQLTRINTELQKPTFVWPLRISLLVIALAIGGNIGGDVGPAVGIVILVVGLIGTSWVRRKIETERTTTLFYTYTDMRFAVVQDACEGLSRSERVWLTMTEQQNFDWKRRAGADTLVNNRGAQVKRLEAPLISTNVTTWGIDAGGVKVLFFPDTILIYQERQYEAVPYESLNIKYSPTRFVEPSPPRDAEIAGHTWQYVRKDGGPDLRFSNNRQIPMALYGLLRFDSPSDTTVKVQVSNRSLAVQFAQSFANVQHGEHARRRSATGYQRGSGNRQRSGYQRSTGNRRGTGKHREAPRTPNRSKPTGAHEILQVTPDASKDEIVAAYRKMAQMYHPDKVASLAPEFQELAERRMKEINAAYAELVREAR